MKKIWHPNGMPEQLQKNNKNLIKTRLKIFINADKYVFMRKNK